MTITIELAPQVETYLREKAARQGQDLEAVAGTTLAEAMTWEEQEFEETVAGIQRGLDAAAAGREKPWEQYVTEQRAKRGQPDTWPSPSAVREVAPGVFNAARD
ncbi:MAG: hypothetical protein M3Y28_07005 [Armatimonadota bacterium]|nr:hypothetical protein [Armatimonadota bacterium]